MKEPPSPLEFQDLASLLEVAEGQEQADAEHVCPELSQILESVFSSMAEAVVVADECGRTALLNPAAEQFLGQAAIGVPLAQWPEHYGLYLPDQVTLYPAEELPLARAIRGEAVDRVEIFLRSALKPSGAWVLVTTRPLRDKAGKVLGGVAVFNEVTGTRKAEEALRKSQEEYRSLYSSTPVMMHSIDQEGRLLSVSDFWLEKLGYERSEVLGRKSVEFLTPESRKYALEVVLPRYFQTGKCQDVPYRVVKKDGGEIDILLSAIAERDAQGAIVRSLAVIIDVTERKRREMAQRLLDEASRELVTSLDDEATLQRVAALAVPTVADLCVIALQAGDTSLRPVAIADVSEARARCLREFLQFHPPPADALLCPAQRCMGEPSIGIGGIGLLRHVDEADRPWEELRTLRGHRCLHVPLYARGRCLGVLCLASARWCDTDAPADLALAKELGCRVAFTLDNAQLYRKAQESIRARDEFLSIASHELKTPLTSMKLRVQQLERALAQQPPDSRLAARLSDMLPIFQGQMRRLADLVENLLDVSRINESRLDLHLEPTDLAALARLVADHLREQLDRSGCKLELEAKEPVSGEWDRLRLEQVMLNLLTNAMKYGAGRPIRLTSTLQDGRALLRVSDGGIGISHEAQRRIFERFERAASHNYGGLGLGLFITRQIVEAHHGKIWVESEPGRGATFFVELPLS
ncbi:PAS domain S-box protein [Hyalangium minutum]|uniref:histidine kinase n=1 Tax=Hyalangium minutum TaxID=394096 RepID=A0A085VTZ1_9BACT|nr:PAS domain S-box protein [Hyalangium minutum]KFE58904.1 Sensory box histidine kinase [Hyalangium minutum]